MDGCLQHESFIFALQLHRAPSTLDELESAPYGTGRVGVPQRIERPPVKLLICSSFRLLGSIKLYCTDTDYFPGELTTQHTLVSFFITDIRGHLLGLKPDGAF